MSFHLVTTIEWRKKLQERGFKKSIQDDVICRWHYDEMILDVMPTDESILGFGNIWYKSAIKHAITYQLLDGAEIKVTSAPYFLATKLEAFKGRGNDDFYASHDLEDIISVLDGRMEIVSEIMQADIELKKYLAFPFSKLIKNTSFQQALPGHFIQYGNIANERINMLLLKLDQVTAEFIE
jgi:hypothetical protein